MPSRICSAVLFFYIPHLPSGLHTASLPDHTLRLRVRSILLPLFVLLLAEWYNIAAALTHDSSLFLDVYDWNHEQGELS